MKVNIGVIILLLITVGLLIYTLATTPDPYRYGQCPEGWHTVNVQTTCHEDAQ